MLRNYLKIAFRTLRRRTGYALINGVGFTVGLVCCVLVLLFIRHELRYDRFHENEEDVYRVLRDKRGNWWSTIPFPDYEDATAAEQRRLPRALVEQIPQIEAATNFYVGPHGEESPAYIERGDRQFSEAQLLHTTTGQSFFEVFPFDFLHGTRKQALAAPGTAVLTKSAAERYFGRTDVVGESLTIRRQQGERTVEVTGVIEDVPAYSHFTFDVALHVDRIRNWGAFTYFRLKPSAGKPATLANRIENVMNEVRPARVKDPGLRAVLGDVRVQALTDIHLGPRMLYDQKQHRDPRYLWAFGAIGVLILLIVVINYTNLAVALSTERKHEIGVRKAMGSGRGQVAAQFLTEAVALTLLCLPVVAIALKGAIPVFNQVMGTQLQNTLLRPGLLGGLVGLAVVVGSIAGIYPALVLSRKETVSLFRGSQDEGGPQRWSMRHLLIGVQFALLIGLGSVTWLVNSQLHFLQTKDLGFRTQGLVEVSVDSAGTYRRLKQRLRSAPEVQAVGAGVGPGPGRFEVTYRAQDSDRVHSDGDLLNVTPGWFEALGIDHSVVRKMRATGGQGTPRLIVNRAAVEALGYENPVGKRVVIEPANPSPDRPTIDGVVDNFHFRPLYQRVQPTFLRVHPRVENMDPLNVRSALVRLDPQALERGLDRLEAAWTSVRPDTPFDPQFVDTQLAQLYEEEQRIGQMGMGLTGIALVLAVLGLVGLSAYVVQRRTKEIGVRKALGATISGIVLRLNREFLIMVGVALVVAAPVAYLVAEQWLASFAYRIDVSPLVFLGAGGGALLASLAAASYQAWSAARVNPADALRQE